MTESWEEFRKRREKQNESKTDEPDFKPEGRRLPRGQMGLDTIYGKRGLPESKFEGKLNAAQARERFLTPKTRSGLGVLIEVPYGKDGTVEYVNDTGRIAHISGRRVDTGSNPNSIEFRSKFTGVTHTIPRDSIRMFANEQPKFTRVPLHYHGGLTTSETCTICRNFKEE